MIYLHTQSKCRRQLDKVRCFCSCCTKYCLQTSKVPGRLDLLLLDPVLDGLGVDQLLQLLLLGDQEVVLVSISLGGDGVVPGGHGLTVHHGDGEVGGGGGDLALLVELSLGRGGVQDGCDGLPIDHGGGEVCRSLSSTERIVGTGSGRETGREASLGTSSGIAKQS